MTATEQLPEKLVYDMASFAEWSSIGCTGRAYRNSTEAEGFCVGFGNIGTLPTMCYGANM